MVCIDLAAFRELEAFAQARTELDKATQKQLDRGYRMVELLKQPQYRPFSAIDQVSEPLRWHPGAFRRRCPGPISFALGGTAFLHVQQRLQSPSCGPDSKREQKLTPEARGRPSQAAIAEFKEEALSGAVGEGCAPPYLPPWPRIGRWVFFFFFFFPPPPPPPPPKKPPFTRITLSSTTRAPRFRRWPNGESLIIKNAAKRLTTSGKSRGRWSPSRPIGSPQGAQPRDRRPRAWRRREEADRRAGRRLRSDFERGASASLIGLPRAGEEVAALGCSPATRPAWRVATTATRCGRPWRWYHDKPDRGNLETTV